MFLDTQPANVLTVNATFFIELAAFLLMLAVLWRFAYPAIEQAATARQKQIATGELLTFDNQIDPTTGTVKLKASFANEDEALFPNQFVNARLQVDVHEGATLISSAAVQRNPQGAFVYLVKPDHTVSAQPVSVGTTDGDTTEILTGLSPGDAVASDNFDKLQDGMRVSPKTTVAGGRAG